MNLNPAVAGLKTAHLPKITLAFEVSGLTLTVPVLRPEIFAALLAFGLRAFGQLHHFPTP